MYQIRCLQNVFPRLQTLILLETVKTFQRLSGVIRGGGGGHSDSDDLHFPGF